MNVHQKHVAAAAAQQNLDLAVVGNGRTLALVNPLARIVWWCFPRYDGDPVFCRLISGEEEKGFTDVVLDGCTCWVGASGESLLTPTDRDRLRDVEQRMGTDGLRVLAIARKQTSTLTDAEIIPAPAVKLLVGSIRMKLPVARLSP